MTSNCSNDDYKMRGFDGSLDSGTADPTDDSWTTFYDTVSSFLTQGILPPGQPLNLIGNDVASVGAFGTQRVSTPSFSLYVNPPAPFNRGVGNGSASAFVRSLHPLYPPDQIFPINESGLVSFRFQSKDDADVTSQSKPFHFMACEQCGHSVCSNDDAVVSCPILLK